MLYKYLLVFLVTTISGPGYIKAQSTGKAIKKTNPVQLGAYYFDGWTGQTSLHTPFKMIDSFPEREPVWGWLTSSPRIVHNQIDVAADAGLSFFSFCWYYPTNNPGNFNEDPRNHALKLFRKATNKNRLKYCLLVANHPGYIIGPKDWNVVSKAWIELFKDPNYLRANGHPLIIFFSVNTLITQFGSTEAVHMAFDSLRAAAISSGVTGVSIAACTSPSAITFKQAADCGFDVLTGYNYHSAGFIPNVTEIPIDSMRSAAYKLWQHFKESELPYIPTVTINWDPRPWTNLNKSYATDPRYIGFSPGSVYKDVMDVKKWLELNPGKTPKEKIALLYAWNEYGEGAWLTPSRNSKVKLLEGVKKAMK